MKNTPELLLEFIKFNSTLTLLALGAFGWIVAKEVEVSGKFQWYHWLCVGSFVSTSLNLQKLTSLIIAMVKESAAVSPNFVSDSIQDSITWAVYWLWAAGALLVLFLVFQAKSRKEKI